MTKDSDDDDTSLYLRLALGVLPFDVKATEDVLEDLRSEVEDTSWPSVMRRSANLGLVLCTLGLLGVLAMFLWFSDLPDAVMQYIDPIFLALIAMVSLMWIAKFVLRSMQKVDSGDSPLVPERESTRVTSLFEFVTGVCMIGLVGIPLADIWDVDLLLLMFLMLALIGFMLAAVCMTISGAYDFIAHWRETSDDVPLQRPEESDRN